MPIIEATSLEKVYPGPVEAVRGISFAIEKGEIFGLLGPNGAGKSTTVRMLATLSHPTAGSVRVDGHDTVEDAAAVRRSIGYVAQASTVDEQLTGRENLRLQGRLFDIGGAELRGTVEKLLGLLDLDDAADRLVRTYSGGMRRRLDLAMGLIHGPRILLLDEPSAGLDPESRSSLWGEIRRLVGEDGMTVLVTTHYLEEADRLAGRVAIIDHGRIVAEGPPDTLKGGLEGDLVTIQLAQSQAVDEAQRTITALEAVRDLVVEDRRLHARVGNGASAVPQLVGALSGFEIVDVTMSRPTLDDVYLAVTGKRFDEADAAGREKDAP